MNLLQKFRTTFRFAALIIGGLCAPGMAGALDQHRSVQSTIAAKINSVETAGPDVLELLSQFVGSIWILVVVVVAMLVLQEMRRPLEAS